MNIYLKIFAVIDLINQRLERIENRLDMSQPSIPLITALPNVSPHSTRDHDSQSDSPAEAYLDDAEGIEMALQDIAEELAEEVEGEEDEFSYVNNDAEEAQLEFRIHFDRTRDGNYQDSIEHRLSLGESLLDHLNEDRSW